MCRRIILQNTMRVYLKRFARATVWVRLWIEYSGRGGGGAWITSTGSFLSLYNLVIYLNRKNIGKRELEAIF
jgi:hypothetical protein